MNIDHDFNLHDILLSSDSDIKKIFNKRNKQKKIISVSNNDLDIKIKDGWELIKKYKTRSRIKRDKNHDVFFKDRIWCLLANLGFQYINRDEYIVLPSSKQQISEYKYDALVIDDETALIFKCVSSNSLKEIDYNEEISKLIMSKQGTSSLLRSKFSRELKIKFVFATNEIILSELDKDKLSNNNIELLNQDQLAYFEQLGSHLGIAAKYQLLCKLFRNQRIQGLKNKVPAIQGKMGTYRYYSFLIEPDTLLKFSYILHRTNSNSDDTTYQRMVSKTRLKEIRDFLNSGGYFPNSVIINIDNDKAKFDQSSGDHDSKVAQHGILHLPQVYQSAFIIDGQHRLYGYANTVWKTKNSIPVVAFINLPPEKQVEMFVDINYKQKSVAKNLLSTIMSDLKWNSSIAEDAIYALHSRLIQKLGNSADSPLYRRVIIGENKRTDETCITLDYLIRSGFNKSNIFANAKRSKIKSYGYLWVNNSVGADYNLMLSKGYDYFKKVFTYVKDKTKLQWDLGAKGFISMNLGITATIRICDEILAYLTKSEHVHTQSKSSKELFELTKEYLDHILLKVNQFDALKMKDYRKNSSAAGFENIVREFQVSINEQVNEFSPDGLVTWIKNNSGKWNSESKQIVDEIQCSIRDHIYNELRLEYGDDRWWADGVHKEIQKKASDMRIEQGSREPDENYVFLLDYQKIITSNWKLYEETYSDPDKEAYSSSKKGKTKKEKATYWFKKLNDIRAKVSHPEREKVTEEEFRFLEKLKGWLIPRLSLVVQ